MKKKKKNEKQKRIVPLRVFVMTFLFVLAVGFTGLLCYGLLINRPYSEENAISFLWETIPEQVEETAVRQDESRYGTLLADEKAMKEGNIYARPNQKEGIVTLGFAGDILFDDEYAVMANLLNRGNTIENGISDELLVKMRDVDIMMLNNEFPYTDRGTPLEGKTYTFRADTASVNYLIDMGVDVVSLANNHIYDFGETGLLDTINTLSEAQIPYVGAGRNLEEAAKAVYFISGDIKIAIVSATQIERMDNPDTKGATENSPGVFRSYNPNMLCEAVAQAKENSDFVVVFVHWGTENETKPDWSQEEQAPKIAEAGADLIVGAHSHCLQGIKYCNDTPVIYSMGNFWFNSKTVDTGLLQVSISKEGIESIRFVPAIQENSQTRLAHGGEAQRIFSYLESISYNVAIDGEGYVVRKID